jgi:hypothetical protein
MDRPTPSKVGTDLMTKHPLLALALAGAIAACNEPSIPDDPAAMTGDIVARNVPTPSTGTLPTIHVKTSSTDPCGVIFGINSSTVLRRRVAGGELRSARIDDLVVGTDVRVWAGAIADSCPGQGVATAVEIIPSPS